MNRIILIGNGFDLAHGMKTSYGNFMDWFWKEKAIEISDKSTSMYEDSEITIIKTNISSDSLSSIPISIECCLNFENFQKHLSNQNARIFFNNKFLEIITNKHSIQNWVDIENEYYQLLKDSFQDINKPYYHKILELNSDFEKIKVELEKYLNEEQNKFERTRHEQLINCIKQKIYSNFKTNDFIENIEFQKSKCNPDNIIFLNFNYTCTEIFYQNQDFNYDIIHIHGSLTPNDKNPIIFGYGDELDEEYKKIETLNNNEYLENIKSIKYLETDNYKRLLEFVNSDGYQIFIFGHSCGNSDQTLLNTLFEHENCVSIKPFYHLKENGTDNYSDIVRNISRNFNNKAIMRDKIVNKTFCEPLA